MNDYLEIKCLEGREGVELRIFNRWGNEVYFSAGYRNDWDGTYRGEPLPDGAYFYVVEYGDPETGMHTGRSGYIMIHR